MFLFDVDWNCERWFGIDFTDNHISPTLELSDVSVPTSLLCDFQGKSYLPSMLLDAFGFFVSACCLSLLYLCSLFVFKNTADMNLFAYKRNSRRAAKNKSFLIKRNSWHYINSTSYKNIYIALTISLRNYLYFITLVNYVRDIILINLCS